jgi:ABC-type sulfate/molybdate transport systems ATPase subunit/ABC-type molybdate transport system permease subunit
LPPLMSGILLIYLVGPYTPLGRTFGLTDSLAGIVIAQTFVAAPFLVIAARSSFAAVDPALTDVAATLGLHPLERFLRVSLPVAAAGVGAGLLLSWLRAFGEFGATVILAYHPYSLPVFTYVQFSGGGLTQTTAPTLLAVVAAVVVLAAVAWQPRRRVRPVGALPAEVTPRRWESASLNFSLDQVVGSFRLRLAYAASSPRLAILGPSGAGKSTTLRCLAGLLGPGAEVRIGGHDLRGVPVEERLVGYVPPEASLLPHLTVWRQVLFGAGALPGLASYWIDRLHLEGLQDRLPDQLSSGQRQRVALARALARSPAMLLLDEPLSSLDTPVRNELRRELRELQLDTGLTSVLVTHDPEEAAFLADEIVVISGGQLLQAGPRAEIFSRPASPEVARLLGIRNLHPGQVTAPGVVRTGGIDLPVADRAILPGTSVHWSVAADHVRVAADGPITVDIVDVADLGTSTELRVRLGQVELFVRTTSDSHMAPAGQCRIEIPPEAVNVWPSSTAVATPPDRVERGESAGSRSLPDHQEEKA